jgi:light-regulated signal transduction histidine kinase (bacteriophytochrome)
MAVSLQLLMEKFEQKEEALKRQTLELARSNADLEQFAYVASHDLQEPLRVVASYAQLFSQRYQGTLDPEADNMIGRVVNGAFRMQQLINDLLIYSRVGTHGKGMQPADCSGVLDDVIANLKKSIEESGATVTAEPLPSVMADRTQLKQLFQNLIDNAIKYRSTQPVTVHVRAQQHDKEWVFAVQDNGIGIHPDNAQRIFVLFQRLHAEEEYPGTGIGLSICQKIVERHGGRIWVESEPYKGSTFYFTLPA